MPGIVGLITRMPRERAEEQLARMVASMCHESFYDAGTWVDESLGVYIGWALRKSVFSSQMPLFNESHDIALVFSGEEYPDPGTPLHLKERGHEIDTDGPSYLVHLYEEDRAFPASLNGMFHGLVTDCRRGEATLFTDRYGMHPVYYHKGSEAFYFAAEAKAILAVRPELRTVDPQGLGEFVSYSCVLQNRTIFQGIQTLPGGSAWVFRNGSLEQNTSYFDPREWEDQGSLDEEHYYRELREVLSRNLSRYFAGSERIGMTLTGGLDTRVIMSCHKSQPGTLPCYTFGGMFRECQDVRVARRVAEVCQQPHQVIPVGREFLKNFPHYAERSVYLTEGGVDVYRASDLYVSELAREIAPVKVVGTYGSEIVRRSVMFKPVDPMPGLFQSEFMQYVRGAREIYTQARQTHPVTFAAFRQSPWYHHGILSLEQTQLSVRSPFLDNDFVRAVYQAPQTGGLGEDVRLRLIQDYDPVLGKIRSDRGVGGPGGISSALARGFLEFTFKSEYAYDYGMPQWVSRTDHFLSAFRFERLFLGRHKLLHFRVWYRDALAGYVRDMLLDPRTLSRPYLNRQAVEAIVEGHTRQGRNYTTEIHKLLTLELLQRLFFDPQSH